MVLIRDIVQFFRKKKSFSLFLSLKPKFLSMVSKSLKNNKLNILIELSLVMQTSSNLSYLVKRLLINWELQSTKTNLVSFWAINSTEIQMKRKMWKILSKIWSTTSLKMLSSDSFNYWKKFTMMLTQQISSRSKDTKSSLFDQEISNLASTLW